jgi:hypothetical protein
MDMNFAAWMIAGGPRQEDPHSQRDREQLHAFRESQRVAEARSHGLIARFRGLGRPAATETDLACCPA